MCRWISYVWTHDPRIGTRVAGGARDVRSRAARAVGGGPNDFRPTDIVAGVVTGWNARAKETASRPMGARRRISMADRWAATVAAGGAGARASRPVGLSVGFGTRGRCGAPPPTRAGLDRGDSVGDSRMRPPYPRALPHGRRGSPQQCLLAPPISYPTRRAPSVVPSASWRRLHERLSATVAPCAHHTRNHPQLLALHSALHHQSSLSHREVAASSLLGEARPDDRLGCSDLRCAGAGDGAWMAIPGWPSPWPCALNRSANSTVIPDPR